VKKYTYIASTAALLLSSCSTPPNHVAERKRYWENVVHAQIPVGSSYDDVERWASARQLHLVQGQSANTMIAGLESVPVNDRVCKGFGISLQLTFDANRYITQETVNSLGNCI
jgi:hypothetical protein